MHTENKFPHMHAFALSPSLLYRKTFASFHLYISNKPNSTTHLLTAKSITSHRRRRRMAGTESDNELKALKATELRLGLPGIANENEGDDDKSSSPYYVLKNNKRCYYSSAEGDGVSCLENQEQLMPSNDSPAPKAQVVGWPPVRSYRKCALMNNEQKKRSEEAAIITFVKVSMDGAPYLRKIDLSCCKNYSDLLKALKEMFDCHIGVHTEREGCHGSEYAPTYEDKDGDWMLVGDVPWDMFVSSCKRVRIMKRI